MCPTRTCRERWTPSPFWPTASFCEQIGQTSDPCVCVCVCHMKSFICDESLHDDQVCCAWVFLQQLVQSDLTIWLNEKKRKHHLPEKCNLNMIFLKINIWNVIFIHYSVSSCSVIFIQECIMNDDDDEVYWPLLCRAPSHYQWFSRVLVSSVSQHLLAPCLLLSVCTARSCSETSPYWSHNTNTRVLTPPDIKAEDHLIHLNLLVFLWFNVDVSKNGDVWKVDPEFTE